MSNVQVFTTQDGWLGSWVNTTDYIDPYVTYPYGSKMDNLALYAIISMLTEKSKITMEKYDDLWKVSGEDAPSCSAVKKSTENCLGMRGF